MSEKSASHFSYQELVDKVNEFIDTIKLRINQIVSAVQTLHMENHNKINEIIDRVNALDTNQTPIVKLSAHVQATNTTIQVEKLSKVSA